MDTKPRATTSRDSDKYIVRFPEGMRERLHAAALANGRTLNAEIVARLDRSTSESGRIEDLELVLREQRSFTKILATFVQQSVGNSHALPKPLQSAMLEIADTFLKSDESLRGGVDAINKAKDLLVPLTFAVLEMDATDDERSQMAAARNRLASGEPLNAVARELHGIAESKFPSQRQAQQAEAPGRRIQPEVRKRKPPK